MHDTVNDHTFGATRVKLLLTIDEAAAALGLGRTLLYDLLMQNQIQSIKVGRVRRIPLSALEDFVARQLLEQCWN